MSLYIYDCIGPPIHIYYIYINNYIYILSFYKRKHNIIITTTLMMNVLTGFALTFSLSVDDVGVVTSGRESSEETSSSKLRTIKCTPYEMLHWVQYLLYC